MPGVAVQTLDVAGGQQLAGGAPRLKHNGRMVVTVGDPVQPHGSGAHAAPVMVEGNPRCRVNGRPICRAGHLASCGHPTTGRPHLTLT